jgi:hypothetical protein
VLFFSNVVRQCLAKDGFNSSLACRIPMTRYRIVVFCPSCDRTHPARATLFLNDGPSKRTTVGEAYKDKPLPPRLAKMLSKDTLCPELAISLKLEDPDKVYLVPIDQ